MSDVINLGKVEPVFTKSGQITGYRLEIQHKGLHEYRLLRAPNQYLLKNKADTQLAAWKEKWQRANSKAALFQSKFQNKESADTLTKQAEQALDEAKNLLITATQTKNCIINQYVDIPTYFT